MLKPPTVPSESTAKALDSELAQAPPIGGRAVIGPRPGQKKALRDSRPFGPMRSLPPTTQPFSAMAQPTVLLSPGRCPHAPGTTDDLFEPQDIHRARIDLQHVTGRPRLQQPAVAIHSLPQPNNVTLQGFPGTRRRRPVPQPLDQSIGGDDPVGLAQQQAQQPALHRATNLDRAASVLNLEGAQDAELHGLRLYPGSRLSETELMQ